MKARGKFIVFDGMEGAGKSTQVQAIARWLTDRGHEVVVTREPGGTPMAEELRAIIKRDGHEPMDPVTEVMLMWAARRQHVKELIMPALDRGKIVLCDRFIPSTLAYQVYGRGLPQDVAFDPFLNMTLCGGGIGESLEGALPDLTVILDVPPEVSAERVHNRGTPDRFEQEDLAFFERVRGGYRAYRRMDRSALVIDGAQPADEVTRRLAHILVARAMVGQDLCGEPEPLPQP